MRFYYNTYRFCLWLALQITNRTPRVNGFLAWHFDRLLSGKGERS